MIRRIVLPVDANISPGTKLALHVAGELFEQSSPELCLFLLHVIPVPYVSLPSCGMYRLQPTPGQRRQAENSLSKARSVLREQGIHPEHIEILLRHGTPADEIVKAARELDADIIVIGSQGSSCRQQIRRFFAGSTSRQVLKLAPCRVMIASLSQTPPPCSLVIWYKQAITQYLHACPDVLRIFTSDEVAHMFAPPNRAIGHKEVEAASLALEQLSHDGMLFCHTVQGQLRYMND
jgi:nucleotide-binding universal stress UspA family protein